MTDSGEQLVDRPTSYVSRHAVSFGAPGALATAVDADHPLPILAVSAAATSTPLTGTASASTVTGPFTPQLARMIWVTLSGVWAGTAQLLRSTDAGATKLPITFGDGSARGSWTGTVNAAIIEESCAGATYYLQFTRTSGTLTYEVRQ